jgi:hypothetical protein
MVLRCGTGVELMLHEVVDRSASKFAVMPGAVKRAAAWPAGGRESVLAGPDRFFGRSDRCPEPDARPVSSSSPEL